MHARIFESTKSFAQHVKSLHKEISKKISISNKVYKQNADSHRRAQEFAEGDYVMVRLRPERFPSGAVKKLYAWGVGPFKIIKKIESNAYVVDLPSDFRISSTFNITALVAYKKKPTRIPSEPFEIEPTFESEPIPKCPPAKMSAKHDQIEKILDDLILSIQSWGY